MVLFLYSQDLSNCTTAASENGLVIGFLYSQDLSNCTTQKAVAVPVLGFCTLKI